MADKLLCIYHGNCADGFGAAWVVQHALAKGGVEFIAGSYQNPPPDVTGRNVLIVDFSYKKPILAKMADTANSIVILDHHKTAQADLADFAISGSGRLCWSDMRGIWEDFEELGKAKIIAEFDMNRSGARMAWDYFFAPRLPPALIQHIEDRDLWRFKIEGTRQILGVVFSYPYDFHTWDALVAQVQFPPAAKVMIAEGAAIERKHFKDIDELLGVVQREMILGGITVPVANLPYTFSSDAGHKMATEHPSRIGACYCDTPEGRLFSLRSTDDGPDVSAIAKLYGGGGHAHAAGFRVAIGWEGEASS